VRDAGMIQRSERLGLALEAREAIGISGDELREHLDRHVAIQLRIARAIHFAHAADAERAQDALSGPRDIWACRRR
jgi:hypothetical protein